MDNNQYQLSAYDYVLPEERIAQQPTEQREQSRLLVLDCVNDQLSHRRFTDITELLRPDDLLVVNNTKVFPARLVGQKETGGRVELLLLHFPEIGKHTPPGRAHALCLIKCSKRPQPGSLLYFPGKIRARVKQLRPDGKVEVTLLYPVSADLGVLLDKHGWIPLPPYISRPEGSTRSDVQRYQTRYARHTGSVAAPTAGLHFSDQLIHTLEARGIQQVAVTLHVGYGTFAPVRSKDIRNHEIHEEFVQVSEETARAVNRTKAASGRIWAVGTTTARTLEFAADSNGRVQPLQKLCGLYIYPDYQFKVINNLITNFHLPKSSLLFLVSALAGRKKILRSYNEAIQRSYRFFSYGDAMAILTKK
ncbi:MAG: tRNA preQ1(34) S-adenosylmethionine ribosyltransferase-isomerase QueA [Desulfocapsa sp.]|nr:MAG: tRNA preQ1(34) S-adenosylmethionine ribosyltransferase-isomerase QueA [Desulfocapsa sp.]